MFSYKVAGALKLVEHPVIHVNDVLESGTLTFGQNDTPDEIIAEWCGPSQHVLVTVDADFRGRWLRSGLLAAHRVEVVVFSSDVPGLANQHATISTRQSPGYCRSGRGNSNGCPTPIVFGSSTRTATSSTSGQARRTIRHYRPGPSSVPQQPCVRSRPAAPLIASSPAPDLL